MLLELLHQQSGFSYRQLEYFASTASTRYRTYEIAKRTGGTRTIAQPSRTIKTLQRWLNRFVIGRFPVHRSATAYSKGANIRDNAARHIKSNFTLHADFESFFPSFGARHVKKFLKERSGGFGIDLTEDDVCFFQRLVCRFGALTIGAPSSPLLTNAMMFDFDTALDEWCVAGELVFTRYADDLFVSSDRPNVLAEALSRIGECSATFPYASLRINAKKTAFLSRRYRRSITGIIVTPTHDLSIGRERKTHLKAGIYQFQLGRLAPEGCSRLRGMLAFVRDVDSTFYATLVRKYGSSTIAAIEHF